MYFEDFVVGQRFSSKTREVTEHDLTTFARLSGDVHPLHTDAGYAATTRFGRPVLHGPFGVAVFFGLFHELGLVDESVVALLDTNWRYLRPVHVGDTLRFEMTITRCQRSSSGDQGVVNRHVVLLNQHDERVQEGTTALLVRARDTGADRADRAFGTLAWGQALAQRLTADERFVSATANWDGTLGLRSGEQEIQLRIYRGQVVDVTRRAPHGATFTVEAPELIWTELISAPHNDFVKRTMSGQFDVRGSGYEYLRLTKAVVLLMDNVRTLARGEQA
jgi:acyl dehydratase